MVELAGTWVHNSHVPLGYETKLFENASANSHFSAHFSWALMNMKKAAIFFCITISLLTTCGRSDDPAEASSYLKAMFAQLQSIEKYDLIAKGESLVQNEDGGLGTQVETFRWRRDLQSNVDEFFKCKVLEFEDGEKKLSVTKYAAMASGPRGVLHRDFPKKPYLVADSVGPEKFLRCSNAFHWQAIAIIPFPPAYLPEEMLAQMIARCTVPSSNLECSVGQDEVRIALSSQEGARNVWVLDRTDYLPKSMFAENPSSSRKLADSGLALRQAIEWKQFGDFKVPISVNGERQRSFKELDDDGVFVVNYQWRLKWITVGESMEPTDKDPSAVIQDLSKVREMLDFDRMNAGTN